MFKLHPFFQLDGADGGWDGVFDSPAPAEDEQPAVDSEATEEEQPEPAVEEVQEDQSEGSAEPEEAGESEGEEKPEENGLSDDTQIDMGDGQLMTLGELKKGYLRQSDYTRKTQALAEERKAFEAERNALAPVKKLSDFLAANPYVREQVQRFIREFSQTGRIPIEEALQDAVYGQYINALMAQNEQLRRELETVRAQLGEVQFTGTMRELKAQLKAEYGDLATDEYLASLEERAKTENIPLNVLKEIADAHLAKEKLAREQKARAKAAKQAEAKTYQKLREKADSLPSQPQRTGQVPKKMGPDDPYKPWDWDDVFS